MCVFYLYGDRDHDGKIDHDDIQKIRNPVYLHEWNSFGLNEFLPIRESEFYLFMSGKYLFYIQTTTRLKRVKLITSINYNQDKYISLYWYPEWTEEELMVGEKFTAHNKTMIARKIFTKDRVYGTSVFKL